MRIESFSSMAGSAAASDGGFEEWSRGNCLYKCEACERPGIFQCSFAFWRHVRAEHEMNEAEFKARFADRGTGHIVHRTTHVCGLCAKEITFDNGKLKLHFNKHHPTVTLEDYYENFIRGKKGANVSQQAKTSTPKVAVKRERTESGTSVSSFGGLSGISDPPATRTLNDSGLEADLSLVKQEPDADTSETGVAKRPRLESMEMPAPPPPPALMRKSQTVKPTSLVMEDGKPWYDGCEYQCNFCPLAPKHITQIMAHLKRYHQKPDIAKGEGYVATETKIECAICSVSVLRNMNSLKQHLHRHKITLEDYGQRYVAGRGSITNESKTLVTEDDEKRKYAVPKNVPWYDRCAYKCKGCGFIAFSGQDQKTHCKKCPSLPEKGKVAVNFDLVEQVIHDCKICSSKVTHERSAISNHLKAHDISLSDYAVNYQPYKKDSSRSAVLDRAITKHWFDGCEYRCAFECPHTAKSKNAIGQHLKGTHKERPKEGVTYHVIQESSVQCRICHVNVLHNEGQIRAHLTNSHSMTLEDYAEKYVKNGVLVDVAPAPELIISKDNEDRKYVVPKNIPWYDRCAFKCKGCGFIAFSHNQQEGHCKKCPSLLHIGKISSNFEIAEQVIHECRICSDKVKHERTSIEGHIKSRHSMSLSDYGVKYQPYKTNSLSDMPSASSTSRQWFDGCQYNCAKGCPFTAKSRTSMSAHVKSVHKEKSMEGINFSVVEESFMACTLCSVDIYKNECQIRQHLTTRHSITLEDFAEQYVKNGELEDSTTAPPPLDKIKGIETPKNIPWYDRCAYRCKSCQSLFWSVGTMTPHLRKCSGGKAEKEIVRNTIHICNVCSYRVLHERSALDRHVSRHGMSLSDYAVKYKPYAEGKMKKISHEEADSKSWFDRCEYKCSLDCSYTAKGRNAITQHLKYTHKKKAKEGENYVAIQEEYMQCQICSVDMYRSEGPIRAHLQYHSMTLEDYGEKFIKNGVVPQSAPETVDKIEGILTPKNIAWYDRCAYRCKECMEIFWSTDSISRHTKKCKNGQAERELVRSKIHECKLCGFKLLQERSALTGHIVKRHGMSMSDYSVKFTPYVEGNMNPSVKNFEDSKNWFDGCEYKCKLACSSTAKSRGAMSMHLKSVHKEKANEGVNYEVVQELYMQCQICSVDMFWSEGQIRSHLQNQHEMTMEDYGEKYVKNGIVPLSSPEPIDKIEGMVAPKNIPWYDRCAYRCKHCRTIFWTTKSVHGHIKICNNGQAEKEIVRSKIHVCNLCGYRVLQERSAITSHIVNRHNLSVTDYAVKFTPYADENPELAVKSDKNLHWFDGCEYACMLCSYSNKTRQAVGHHLKCVHKIEKASENEHYKVAKETNLDCKLCSLSVLRNESQIKLHLTRAHTITMEEYAARFVHGDGAGNGHLLDAPAVQTTNEDVKPPKSAMWYNRCCFRCKTCQYMLWDETSMNSHLRKCPWLAKTGQKRAESELAVRNVYRCKICNFAVTHKRGNIDSHLRQKHNISLMDYGAKYESGK